MNKKIYLYLIGLFTLISFSSCNDLLNTQPTDFISSNKYFKNSTDAYLALSGIYAGLNEVSSSTYIYNVSQFDDLAQTNTYYTTSTGIFYNQFTSNDVNVNALWKGLYKTVERSNVYLENLANCTVADSVKNNYKGEALFLRSYCYFLLSTCWGDVPLILSPVKPEGDVTIARTPQKLVFDQIISDMQAANKLVKSSANFSIGRVSKSAVQGILARVYLKRAGFPFYSTNSSDEDGKRMYYYQQAKNYCDTIINSGLHSLNSSQGALFKQICGDQYDLTIHESIWELEYKGSYGQSYSTGSGFAAYMGPACQNSNWNYPGYCYGYLAGNPKLFGLFEAGDTRKSVALCDSTYTTGADKVTITKSATKNYFRAPGKFRREWEVTLPKDKNATGINFPVLRYADVLLMRAEAENELNGPALALADINAVRFRAGVALYAGATNITDKTIFRQKLKDERARELCFEALRKYDLIRWGDFVTAMRGCGAMAANKDLGWTEKTYSEVIYNRASEKLLLLPIPASEITLNPKLTQNPGWY